ncbi:MAG: hypothetical protein KF777_09035 [Planctomycetaceae bacterium]|nr:hypothetical protein [Planctomycetaceae bacterium]
MSPNELLIALRSRRECCRALVGLSHGQNDLIATEAYDELLPLLRQKQELIDQLVDGSDGTVAPWADWTRMREHLSPPVRAACEEALRETQLLMSELMDLERTGTTQLTASRDATQRELAAISKGVNVHSAYHELKERTSSSQFDFQL